MTPAQAIEGAHALKPYRPYFYEDPIPDNMAAMTKLTEEIDLPVATGERFINLMEFDEFIPSMCVSTKKMQSIWMEHRSGSCQYR